MTWHTKTQDFASRDKLSFRNRYGRFGGYQVRNFKKLINMLRVVMEEVNNMQKKIGSVRERWKY